MFESMSAPDPADGGPWGSVYGSWRPPGEVLAGHVADGTRSVEEATTQVAPLLPRVSGDELTDGLESIDRMRARTDTLTLHVVIEALNRGLHTDTGLSAHDWLTRRCPWLAPAAVNDLVTVAKGVGEPLHAHLREQVLSTTLPVRRAAAVLRALGRVKPFLATMADPDVAEPDVDAAGEVISEYEAAVGALVHVAADAEFTDRDLRKVTDHLASTVLPEKDHDARQKAASELRGVNESSLADGSLFRFIMTCDAEGAAFLRSILSSPLAAPSADESGPDPRTATQRRYDALMTVLKRGVAGGDSAPTTAKANVNITIAWDLLKATFTGAGTTTTGEVLSPQTVRRMACDADLIPMVLGTEREILEMGRTRRLVTPGQRRALEHRDRGCSFPGCTIPASWCDAHHVVYWSRDGASDLWNYALLCCRHHTLVHDRDLTATVHPTGVTWHL